MGYLRILLCLDLDEYPCIQTNECNVHFIVLFEAKCQCWNQYAYITLWFCRLKDQGFILYTKNSLHSFDFIDDVGFKCSTQCAYIDQSLTLELD